MFDMNGGEISDAQHTQEAPYFARDKELPIKNNFKY